MAEKVPPTRLYTVTNVMERTRPTAQGKFEQVIEVSYQTTRGQVGTVSAPVALATPAHIKTLIDAAVANVEAIFAI